MKRSHLFFGLFLGLSSIAMYTSWFGNLRNWWQPVSSSQPVQELTDSEQNELELLHLRSLRLDDLVARLELQLRHLQSLQIEREIEEVNAEILKMGQRLAFLQGMSVEKGKIEKELRRAQGLILRERELQRILQGGNI